jgi:hypothetical protein
MTADEHTGTLTFPEIGATITPDVSRERFLRTPAFVGASILVSNEPWCSYRIPDVPLPETSLSVSVQFRGERLVSVSLCHGAERYGSSWSDWSEERELARKAFHDRWLALELHLPPGRYPWGDVDSRYDAKAGCSSITFSYAERNG